MREVLVRSLTGVVYILVTVGAALAGPFTTMLLFLPIALMSAIELHRLQWQGHDAPPIYWAPLITVALYLTIAIGPSLPDPRAGHPFAVAALLLFITAGWVLMRRPVDPTSELGAFSFTLIYIALPFATAPLLVAIDGRLFIGTMALLWTSDTAAYVTGRSFGRHLLVPHISPKKTVEGLLGAILFTTAAAWFLSHYWSVLSLGQWIIVGAIVVVAGTLGDLLESAFKRAAQVKDSGDLLPGHGGLLDRFDGFLIAAPAVWLYLHAAI